MRELIGSWAFVVLIAAVLLLPGAALFWWLGYPDIAFWAFIVPTVPGLWLLGRWMWQERGFVRRQVRARRKRRSLIDAEFHD